MRLVREGWGKQKFARRAVNGLERVADFLVSGLYGLEGQPIVSSYQELENLVQADCENLIALFGAEQ